MSWEKVLNTAIEFGHSKVLREVKEGLEASGLPTPEFYADTPTGTITLSSGELVLGLIVSGAATCKVLKLPDSLFPESFLDKYNASYSGHRFSLKDILGYFHYYGKDQKWEDRTEVELLKLQERGSLQPITLYQIQATNELARRQGSQQRAKDYFSNRGISVSKCGITGIYSQSFMFLDIPIFSAKGSKKQTTVNQFSLNLLEKLFVNSAWGWSEKDQDFAKIDNREAISSPEIIHGSKIEDSRFNSYIQHVPVNQLEKLFKTADCGHLIEKTSDSPVCKHCMKNISSTGKIINEYSCRAPKFLGFLNKNKKEDTGAKEVVYFGAELELENGGEPQAIKLYQSLKDFMLCKSDGSISRGFEIITAPSVYEVHKEKAATMFSIIRDQTKMRADSNCGLHFHVSRSALSTMQIGKLLEFLYNPDNKSFVTKIAGRSDSSYATLDGNRTITAVAPEIFSIDTEVRYEGLNLRNPETIEFRIFASTTEYSVFMHRLDFVRSLIDYTRPCAVNVKSLSQIKEKDIYLSFLEGNKKTYPFLTEFLGIRKAIPEQFKNKEQQSSVL